MLELGSTAIGKEIMELAELRFDFATWEGKDDKKDLGSLDDFLGGEITRLQKAGHTKKIVGLLEFRRGALRLDGLGKAHPEIKRVEDLIARFAGGNPKTTRAVGGGS